MYAPAAPTQAPGKSFRRRAGAIKIALASGLLFLTGGPSVMAQFEESPAAYWRQERERTQRARAPAPRNARSVEQRPTRLIRGAAPKKGFTRVVPQQEEPAPGTAPAPGTQNADTPAATPAPAQPGQTPALTAPAGAPPQQRAATPPGQPAPPAIRIVVMGDNVGQLLARGLELAFHESPQIGISRQTRDSSGLVNNRFFDWGDAARKLLSGGEKVDIAIMMLGSNDAQELLDGKERHRVRSDPWNKIYKARIEAIVTQFRDRKIPLLWVGMPIMRGERLSAEMLAFNEIYREAVQRAGGVYVDIWEGFVDDRSRFTLFGPDVNGQIVKLRAGDGVHFTPAGSRKLAYFLESPLKRLIDERRPRTDPVIAALAPGEPGPAPSIGPAVAPDQPQPGAMPADPASRAGDAPVIAALPPAAPIPRPMVAPPRAAAGPVIRLTAADLSLDGELATRRRKSGDGVESQSGFLQRRLVGGAPIEAQPGRADDFSWPRR